MAVMSAPAPTNFWLMKSEPEAFSIDDLRSAGRAPWDGVRNYQARNFIRDQMKVGDLALFYRSNASPPGVVGVARVASAARPDPTALDPKHAGFDPRSDPQAPRWFLVDVEFVEELAALVSLAALKQDPALKDMLVVQKGQRLSVQPVTAAEFSRVLELGRSEAARASR